MFGLDGISSVGEIAKFSEIQLLSIPFLEIRTSSIDLFCPIIENFY